jgi:ketosteroid isomerase-like protein
VSAEAEIAVPLDRWAASVRAHDLDGATQGRSASIVMFDVPAPLQARGVDAYRDTWRLYFQDPGSRRFALQETRIVAEGNLAWVHALLLCTLDDAPAGRLTMGLRRVDGRWVVEHEHHSFPIALDHPGA